MTATLTDIREAVAASIQDALGIQALPYVGSNPTPPCAVVMRGTTNYDQAMGGGLHDLEVRVRVYVSDVLDFASSENLDQYLAPDGDLSVKAAIEADTSLGGLVQDLHVTESTGEQVYVRDSGGPLLGSEFQVTVFL